MKSRYFSAMLFCCATLALRAAQADRGSRPPQGEAAAALQVEADIVRDARATALRDDDASADSKLKLPAHARSKHGQSATLARRAAAVCAWLRNDNEYARAEKLARRTIAQLTNMREANVADQVERLYWEAMLEGEILDRKERALRLLEEAAQLAPSDRRIAQEKQRWSATLAAFGK